VSRVVTVLLKPDGAGTPASPFHHEQFLRSKPARATGHERGWTEFFRNNLAKIFSTDQRGGRPHATRNNVVLGARNGLPPRKAHLAHEKEYNQGLRDRLSEERRALPWVKVDKDYVFGRPRRQK